MVKEPHTHHLPLWTHLLFVLLLAPCIPVSATEIDSLPTFRMIATFYADKFHGRKTSSGEIFDQSKATAAHISIKLGTWVRVTNTRNNEQIIVKINDRCPKRGVIDLTRSAAKKIGIRGTAPVIVEILPTDYAVNLLAQSQLEESLTSPAPNTTELVANKTDNKSHPSTASATQQLPEKGKGKEPTKDTKTAGKKEGQKVTPTTIDNNRYNILLCKTATQRQALQEVEKLPLLYQESVKISADPKQAKHLVVLDLSLNKHQAREICKSIQKAFPNCEPIQIPR